MFALLLAFAQSFAPLGPETVPHPTLNGNQRWTRVAYNEDASQWVAAWTGSNEVFMRPLRPLFPARMVNQITFGTQDEVEVVILADGRIVVMWTDRSSMVTSYMSAEARVFDANGGPITNEFPLSDLLSGDTSRWRPLPCALRNGGWAAAWTEGWNDDTIIRVFDSSGVPLIPDVMVATPIGGHQDYPTIAEGKGGRLLTAWRKAAGQYPDDLWGRVLGPDGSYVSAEMQLSAFPGANWNESEPRLATNARGFTVMVSQGNASHIWAVTFGPDLKTRISSFAVQQTFEKSRDPAVDIDSDGNWIVTWENFYTNEIWAAYFDINGHELVRWRVNSLPLGKKYPGEEKGRRTPSVAITDDGTRATFGWSGASQASSTDVDGYVREFVLVP